MSTLDKLRKAAKAIYNSDYVLADKQLVYWPDCATTGCTNKVCTWGSEVLCFPCEEKIVGTEEMHRRYDLTHERAWSVPSIEGKSNYMLKTYAEIQDYDN